MFGRIVERKEGREGRQAGKSLYSEEMEYHRVSPGDNATLKKTRQADSRRGEKHEQTFCAAGKRWKRPWIGFHRKPRTTTSKGERA